MALSAAGASLTIFTWLGKIPPWGTGRFHCAVPHFIMPTYRGFNHASHLEDPRAASRSSKPSQQPSNMRILPPRLHIKPAPQTSACKPSTVAKKSSHQEGCDCWCMPDEQDAQDGIAMQLQPFVSLWKILYLTHKMWVLLQGFSGGICVIVQFVIHQNCCVRNEIWEGTLEVLKLSTTLSFSLKIMPFNSP